MYAAAQPRGQAAIRLRSVSCPEIVRAVRALFSRLASLFRSLFGRTPDAPSGFVEIELDDSIEALDEIEHIVVLMLENRSFDHMLGYLSLEPGGLDVDGLQAGMANEYEGHSYPIFELAEDRVHEGAGSLSLGRMRRPTGRGRKRRLRRRLHRDPRGSGVSRARGRHGLLRRRAAAGLRLPRKALLRLRPLVLLRQGSDLPEPSLCRGGRAAGSRDNASPPTYHLPSFVRRLDAAGATWRWYTHELFATIWAIDRDYLPKTFDNVRPFSSPFSSEDFFSAAKSGTLPDVAWIDPNFVDVGGAAGSNDDHPPSDVRAGQSSSSACSTRSRAAPRGSGRSS